MSVLESVQNSTKIYIELALYTLCVEREEKVYRKVYKTRTVPPLYEKSTNSLHKTSSVHCPMKILQKKSTKGI